MKRTYYINGFTLIEMLIASAVAAIMAGVMLNFYIASNNFTSATISVADASERLQVVAAMVGDDVRRASFIEPSLEPPTWVSAPTGSTAITLRSAADADCSTTYNLTYYFVPRSTLTSTTVSEWVRVRDDSRNTGQKVMLRAINCAGTVTNRLVTDYLDDPGFEISQMGTGTFTSSPSAVATGGYPYISVRISLASLYAGRERTVRFPPSGKLTVVATSRTIDQP